MKLSDLPQELQDAIYIESCHVSGMHNPNHTPDYLCAHQLAELAKRVLRALGMYPAPTVLFDDEVLKLFNRIPRHSSQLVQMEEEIERREKWLETARLEDWRRRHSEESLEGLREKAARLRNWLANGYELEEGKDE